MYILFLAAAKRQRGDKRPSIEKKKAEIFSTENGHDETRIEDPIIIAVDTGGKVVTRTDQGETFSLGNQSLPVNKRRAKAPNKSKNKTVNKEVETNPNRFFHEETDIDVNEMSQISQWGNDYVTRSKLGSIMFDSNSNSFLESLNIVAGDDEMPMPLDDEIFF